jgi:hypothetical protein
MYVCICVRVFVFLLVCKPPFYLIVSLPPLPILPSQQYSEQREEEIMPLVYDNRIFHTSGMIHFTPHVPTEHMLYLRSDSTESGSVGEMDMARYGSANIYLKSNDSI